MPSALLAEQQPRPAASRPPGRPGLWELGACRQGYSGHLAETGEGMLRRPGSLRQPLQSQSFQRCTWALPLVLSLHPRPCRKSPGPGAALGGALAPTQGLASAAAPAEVTRGIPLGYRHSPGGGIPLTGTEGALLFGPHATGRALRFPACSCALIQLISSRAPPPPLPCDLVLGFRDLSRVSLEVSSAGGIKLFLI